MTCPMRKGGIDRVHGECTEKGLNRPRGQLGQLSTISPLQNPTVKQFTSLFLRGCDKLIVYFARLQRAVEKRGRITLIY